MRPALGPGVLERALGCFCLPFVEVAGMSSRDNHNGNARGGRPNYYLWRLMSGRASSSAFNAARSCLAAPIRGAARRCKAFSEQLKTRTPRPSSRSVPSTVRRKMVSHPGALITHFGREAISLRSFKPSHLERCEFRWGGVRV